MLHSKDKGCTAAQFEAGNIPRWPRSCPLQVCYMLLWKKCRQEPSYFSHRGSSRNTSFTRQAAKACFVYSSVIFWKSILRKLISDFTWFYVSMRISCKVEASNWSCGWQKVVEEKPKSAASTIAVVSQVGQTVTRWSKYFLVLVWNNFWSLLLHP